jgi:hypothetical protein
MAASKRPSYLKRQKEQARLARAAEKREARRARKHSTGTEVEELDLQDQSVDGMQGESAGENQTEGV